MDLYHEIYLEIGQKLREDDRLIPISVDLKQMRERKQPNSDKIDYVSALLEEYNLFPDFQNLEEPKNDAKSEEFRQQGNSFFSLKTQKYIDAIKAYNRSICFALSKDNISIGIANRSAVFYELGMFKECLESIRLAREMGYPDRLKEKLDKREVKCHEGLQNNPQTEDKKLVPKIELPVNPKIPFLAKCLALHEDKSFGRHVVTEDDLRAGSVIAIEEPFCKVLEDSEKYMRCSNCLREVPHLLLPCKTCSQTMFCSEKCEKEAIKDFHTFECPINGSLYKILDNSLYLVFRTSIYAFSAFPNTENLDKELQKIDMEQKNIFSFDWSSELSLAERYTPIHTLATNEDARNGDYLFKKYVNASLMFKLLKESSPTFSERFLTTNNIENVLKNVLFRHLLTGPTNMHSIHAIEDVSDPNAATEYGAAAYAFHSMVNHSCSPNVTRIDVGTASAMITIKNLVAGDQILDNYGYHHSLMDRTSRQKETQRRYQFVCQCRACLNDFPLYATLPAPPNIPEALPLHNNSTQFQYSHEFAEKGLRRVIKFIRKYGHLYPIFQLCCAEEGMKFCLNVLCGNIRLRLRHKHQIK